MQLHLLVFSVLVVSALCYSCPREPREEHSSVLKSPGDNGYKILVSGEPEMYVPDSVYTLSIVGSRTHGRLQMFTRFMLVVEPADSRATNSPQRVGSFQLFSDSLTTFNENCINTISESDDFPKSEIQVMWNSPPKGSGCVIFKAMVFEDNLNWYADDGYLSRQLCELTTFGEVKEGEEDFECCACDDAQYQMIFEGIWSNLTHPKDFPTNLWLTHFSDVIGATHERNYSFWGEGQIASDGLRMVAEWGSVRGLESELRAKSKHLRTLVKAAGLWHPYVNSNTSSTFRVDRRHPLLSVVSMLGPTPDWIVGVSGLTLCKRDCTWADQKIVDLYPYDAGTDSGITYMSPNAPTIPRERIHKITTMYPEDPRAPFYDPTGGVMKPLARLYLTRTSITPKSCDDEDVGSFLAEQVDVSENSDDTLRPECAVTEYSEWSTCSVTCGKGLRMRQRTYIMAAKAEMLGCNRQLVSKEMCVASSPSCPGEPDDGFFPEDNEAVCTVTSWSAWSACSETCGEGVRMRTRFFVDRMGRKKCPHISTVEKEKCMQQACRGPPLPPEPVDPMCPVTEWNDWSLCSVTCGKGVKVRTRLLLVHPDLQQKCSMRVELVQRVPCVENEECSFDMETAKTVCMLEPEGGVCRGTFSRWYYSPQEGQCLQFNYGGCRGNANNFVTEDDCLKNCGILGRGPGLQEPVPLPLLANQQDNVFGNEAVDCRVSKWTAWSPCSATCGKGLKQRTRHILVKAQNGGKKCPTKLLQKKKCRATPCSTDNEK